MGRDRRKYPGCRRRICPAGTRGRQHYQHAARKSPRKVIAHFKSTGRGWQSRIDETLRKAVKRKAS
jgi:uncharacterized protein (DUF4415 family)